MASASPLLDLPVLLSPSPSHLPSLLTTSFSSSVHIRKGYYLQSDRFFSWLWGRNLSSPQKRGAQAGDGKGGAQAGDGVLEE